MTVGGAGAQGCFISFEGGEGSGKSTQLRLLATSLQRDGINTVETREPGGSPGAESIRQLLLDRRQPLDPLAELLLFAAARADHVRSVIRPALRQGAVVLCDRFTDSTRAYQGGGRSMPIETIDTLETLAVGETRPHLTFMLDIDSRAGLERAGSRRGASSSVDRFEKEALAFHQRIRTAFLAIAAADPSRCRVIDAARPPEVIAAEILRLTAEVLRCSATGGRA